MLSPWRSEFYWLIWLLFFGIFLGKLSGMYFAALWLCSLIYLARNIYHINRIVLWLRSGGKVPQGGGIWEEIYYLIFRLKRRNKSRKKRLLAMLERFRTATTALPDATVVLGPRDEIDWFNDAAERLLGLRKSDIGQQIGNLLRQPKFVEFLRGTDASATITIASPIMDKAQLEIRIVPYGENLRLLVAQDVTHIRFMERVRSDFVANVSHELRTPLTVLKGYLETLEDADQDIPERYRKVFRHMEEHTARMQKLIDGLLSLTKLESGTLAPYKLVDCPGLLLSVCNEAQLLKPDQASLELILETHADLYGVESELRSAFSNLVVNALKYTPGDGKVQVRWRRENGGAVLEVEDTGPGIASEHLPRLTERFYRVEPGRAGGGKDGVGLGLAIVKHVLTRHEAELKIVSTVGKGSCFGCRFPEKRVLFDVDDSK
ncbi:MAG: phosphate regulon sensor histidine kinase PhoR [Methylococcaceae bacterium]|nr:phosphate regulon sensor histidine kinase PhoR [Methylococcaceae bacterium]